jgi:hypothetical protein
MASVKVGQRLMHGTLTVVLVGLSGCCFAPWPSGALSPPSAPVPVVAPPPPPLPTRSDIDDGPIIDVLLPAQLPSVNGTGGEWSVLEVRATRGGSLPFRLAEVERDGETVSRSDCPRAGYRTPNVRVTVTEPIPMIRVLANQQIGLGGILMHLGDGRVLCALELNMGFDHIDTDLPVGVHEIYLGAISGETHPAAVGFTTNLQITTVRLPSPS